MLRAHQNAILFVVTSSVSLGFLAGQVKKLSGRGWRTGAASDPTVVGQLEKFAVQQEAQAFPVEMHREINVRADVQSVLGLYRTMRRFRPLITNVGTPKAGLLGGLAAVAAGVPVRVYTLHGLRLETATGVKGQILNFTERIAIACAHRVVCVSPSLRERVHELGLAPRHKTLVLGSGSPNGVRFPDIQLMESQVTVLADRLGLDGSSPVIGFVGRFTRDKGMAELMAMFLRVRDRLPETQLLLVGDYEKGDPVAPEVRQAIENTPGVVQAGFVPDVMPYYTLMNVLALPTYREGFPTVALEAAASGLPVVISNATGARDAVKDGFNGWRVPTADVDALTTAVLSALQNPAEARKRGEAGRAWVQANFRPEDVQERWIAFYEELLEWRRLSQEHPEKRLLDIMVSAAGLMVLAVPMAGLSLLVRQKLGRPVFFKQVRPGLNGQPFTMYKFRTMTDERGPDGELLPDSVRLTPFGRFLRSTSLDELPELWNVLKGDMSLVGPRPLLMRYTPYFTEEERQRLNVRPGITGWAQVNGRNTASWDDRLGMDVWYVENMRLGLDLKILWMTIRRVMGRSGVVVDAESIMQNLDDERRGRLL